MKVLTHADFCRVYTHDPAAAPGRIEAILEAIKTDFPWQEGGYPAGLDDLTAVHTDSHINRVSRQGLFNIAALAAGTAIEAATIGLAEPCFGLIRPPGHHASADSAWGFCYFNNMAIALEHLRRNHQIETAYVLDFDMHYGDGTVSILKDRGYAAIHNPSADDRLSYMHQVQDHLASAKADVFGISAGFDNHMQDWGGLLRTEDYRTLGSMLGETCSRLGAGCFALLEGGYNQQVLGLNVLAFLQGLSGL
ncbi:histone deacetylase family protein [Desulfoferrobacter suflitae]|uniref:histone deacetylase family protein n=1 Tax=Desulfoferrobacter suflitae TaxID=2865782 RepID=UPI002164C646|nr:histone deacetylase family protein [Desulfoferrobacter suflitae]MCK8602842.1 histone deacetylase family protein [Desulfoferrobacter suflitae]